MTSIQILLNNSQLIVSNIYIKPNSISAMHVDKIRDLFNSYSQFPIILSGDLNARHTLWHDRKVNKHGEIISDLINDLDLYIHNDRKPTCKTINGSSIIDLTLTNVRATPKISQWSSKGQLQSIFDHSLIEFDYQPGNQIPLKTSKSTRIFNERKANWTEFRKQISSKSIRNLTRTIEQTRSIKTIEKQILYLTKLIQKAAFRSIPIIKRSSSTKRSTWWDNELRCMQIVVRHKRNKFSRQKNPETRQLFYEEFKRYRNQYVSMIRKKKSQKWKQFLEEADTKNAWGNSYKILKYKINPKTQSLPIIEDFPPHQHQQIIQDIVNNLFPNQSEQHKNNRNKKRRLVSIIAIDFTGAFDNADWNIIINNMINLQSPQHLTRIITNYFENRTITMQYNGNKYSKTLTKGCPQGSPL
ncbi:hypothetical protein QR98_0042990, partial [Sarcoptes scabiei]